jgi:F-type H+-transporting ATPase subunit b
MSTLLQQLGGLVLGSVPTMVLFLLTLIAYRLLVHTPLTKVLRQRYAQTQGAIEKAALAVADAEAKTAQYERRLRDARAGVFHERQERLHIVKLESETALAEARAAAQEKTTAAVLEIERSAQEATRQMESAIDELAAEVMRVILPSVTSARQEQER